jgi:hypothetical protein
MSPYNIQDINKEIAFLVRACLGEISRNTVIISLLPQASGIQIIFVLEAESQEDRNSIEDIASEYYAMHDDDPKIDVRIEVNPQLRVPPPPPARTIYLRKD